MNSYSLRIFVFAYIFGLLYGSDLVIDEKIQLDLGFDQNFDKTNELAIESCRGSPFHLAVGNDDLSSPFYLAAGNYDFELFDFDFQPIFEIPAAKCIEQKDEVFPTSNFEDFGIEPDLSEDSSESSSILLDDQSEYHQDGDRLDDEDQVDSSDMAEQHSQLSRVKCLTEAKLDRDLSRRTVFQTILERFRSESKLFSSTRINWNLLNREDIPDKYEDVPINGTSLQSILVFKNREIVDNIHFFEHSLLSSMVQKSYRNSYKKCKDTKKQLRELFESQLPGEPYNFRKYDILNWPQEINLYGQKWTASEVQEIKKAFHSFRFVERSSPVLNEEPGEISRVKDIEVKNSSKMTIQSAHSILLERFREETGNRSDLFIRWKLLNREYIPIEYKDIIIDSKTIRSSSIYQNRAIFDNIHFFKSSKKKGKSKKGTTPKIDRPADTSSPLDLAAFEVDLEASIYSAPISDQFVDGNIGLAMESFRSSHFHLAVGNDEFELFDRDFQPIFEFHTAEDELFPSSNFVVQPTQKSDCYLKSSKFSSIAKELELDSSDRTNIHFYKPAEAATTTIRKRRKIDDLDS